MKTLGAFFRDFREGEGRLLEEVAASVDLTPLELEEFEGGVREMTFDIVFALSNVLNVRPDEVIRLMLSLTLAARSDEADEGARGSGLS